MMPKLIDALGRGNGETNVHAARHIKGDRSFITGDSGRRQRRSSVGNDAGSFAACSPIARRFDARSAHEVVEGGAVRHVHPLWRVLDDRPARVGDGG